MGVGGAGGRWSWQSVGHRFRHGFLRVVCCGWWSCLVWRVCLVWLVWFSAVRHRTDASSATCWPAIFVWTGMLIRPVAICAECAPWVLGNGLDVSPSAACLAQCIWAGLVVPTQYTLRMPFLIRRLPVSSPLTTKATKDAVISPRLPVAPMSERRPRRLGTQSRNHSQLLAGTSDESPSPFPSSVPFPLSPAPAGQSHSAPAQELTSQVTSVCLSCHAHLRPHCFAPRNRGKPTPM